MTIAADKRPASLDPFASQVLTASATPVPPDPEDEQKDEESSKYRRLDPRRLSPLGPAAAAVLAAALVGGAALWDRSPSSKARERVADGGPSDRGGIRRDVLYVTGGRALSGMIGRQTTAFLGERVYDAPNFGGAPTPKGLDEVEARVSEARLIERLRSQGKLPPEPEERAPMERMRERIESTRDDLVRLATWRGGPK